jgi:hypothetical protein
MENLNMHLFEMFSPNFVLNYRTSVTDVLMGYVGLERESIIERLYNTKDSWDNYSLSVLYLQLINRHFKNKYEDNKELIYLSKLLLMNISPYVENRHSIKQTIEFLRTIH